MTVLVAGFDAAATERLTRALAEAGYEAAGVGSGLAPTVAAAAAPEAVLVPAGPVGAAVRRSVEEAAPGLRFLPVAPGADLPLTALRARPAADAAPPPAALKASPAVDAAPPPGAVDGEVGGANDTGQGDDLPRVEIMAPSGPSPEASPAPARGGLTTKLTTQRAAKLRAVRFLDYHAVLEVKPTSPAYVVDERYEALRRAFEPTSWPAPLGAQELAELLEILDGLRDAHVVLGDPALRARYERALRQAPGPPTRDVSTERLPR